jgi:hypothetical protein
MTKPAGMGWARSNSGWVHIARPLFMVASVAVRSPALGLGSRQKTCTRPGGRALHAVTPALVANATVECSGSKPEQLRVSVTHMRRKELRYDAKPWTRTR